MRNMPKVKINMPVWKLILIIAVVAFLLYSQIWYTVISEKYDPYIYAPPIDGSGEYTDSDGYRFSANRPPFLHYYGGYLMVNSNEINSVDLGIYPQWDGSYEYCAYLPEDNDGKYKGTECFDVDGNMNPISKLTDEEEKYYNQYKPQADEIYARAKKIWKLE